MKVNRGLRIIGCVAAAWSFTALVTTGQIWSAVTVVSYLLYLLASFPNGPLSRIPKPGWRAITAFAMIFLGFLAYRDLGNALVYLTIYLQVYLIVGARSPRDYLWLFLLSFFQVVLAAAITVHLTFFFVLLGFLGLSVIGMAFLTFERGRISVENSVAGVGGIGRPLAVNGAALQNGRPVNGTERKKTGLPRGYAFRSIGLIAAIILLASLFFLAIPRLAARRVFMRLRPFDPGTVTGFSPTVQAGALGNMVKDRTIVMHAWVRKRNGQRDYRPTHLRLRGLSLNYFIGVRWAPNKWAKNQERPGDRVGPGERFPFERDPDYTMVLDISQDMTQTKWLFGPPYVDVVNFYRPADLRFNPQLHSFRLTTANQSKINYTVQAFIEPPMPEIVARLQQYRQSGRTDWTLSEKEHYEYTAVPKRLVGGTEMRALAEDLTQGADSTLEKLARISRHFRTNFTYSLEGGSSNSLYYLKHFLFRHKKGHCEAYAMAMAVLCRMVDIPARVVTGFYTTEYNRVQNFFYVRQCHAHTWCEIWLDGFGWMTVDPTPPSALREGSRIWAMFAGLADYWDAVNLKWRENVVDFSLTDQLEFLRDLHKYLRNSVVQGDWIGTAFLRLRSSFWNRGGGRAGAPGGMIVLLLLAFLVLAWVLIVGAQQRRSARALLKRASRLARCPVDFYVHILRVLATAGWQMQPDQTPAEFAVQVARANPELERFVDITGTYYRVRFASDELQPEERNLAEQFLTDVARAKRAGNTPKGR